MKMISELEKVLLDQIEKLNDDSLAEEPELAEIMINKSKAMSDLAGQVIAINRLRLDVVKQVNDNGGLYEKYLGIEE